MEGCEDYYRVIMDEMDLEKMKKKVNQSEYHSIESFANDFDLMINNCRTFNYVCILIAFNL